MIEIGNINEPVLDINKLLLVSENNVIRDELCNYIIKNYNTSKSYAKSGVKFTNPSKKDTNNDSSLKVENEGENDYKSKKDFDNINNWSNDNYTETLKRMLLEFIVKYHERTIHFYNREIISGTYLNDSSSFSYSNNKKEFLLKGPIPVTILNVDDVYIYYEHSVTTLPITYEILTENTQIQIGRETTLIKRSEIFMPSIRVLLFLNTVDNGYLKVDNKFITTIECGKAVVFPNSLLFNYEICTSSKVHIVTLISSKRVDCNKRKNYGIETTIT